MINDAELADEIIRRLNELSSNPNVRQDISRLIETRIPCSHDTLDHPTIQADNSEGARFGFLGLLNGLVGAMKDGPRAGWGFIAADFSDSGDLTGFKRTKNS